MKKLFKCLCLLLALVILPACALASARMPAMRGVVTDDANVLSQQTTADVGEYAQLLKEKAGIQVHTAIVHFFDGLDAQTYANRLFEKWELGSEDLLLLVSAGEDVCATAMGEDAAERLGRANAENLMYTSSDFSSLVRTQQYDAAFNAYFTALNTLVEKQTGAKIRMGTMFGSQPEKTIPSQTFGSELWEEIMEELEDSSAKYQAHRERHEHEEEGLTAGGWIVLLVLVWIVISQSRKPGKRSGCGCSPLGWLFGLLGLGFLFNRD